jgi:uncharacterized protein YecE (DUF72 family)
MEPEMSAIHVGCAGFARPRPRYKERLRFVEIELRTPLPSPKVLAGWRAEVGDDFVFALVAQPALWGEPDWPLRDDKAVRPEIDRLTNVANALKPRALVLRTPASIRPGTAALKRFFGVVERLEKLAPICVWEPSGVWEHEAAVEAAADTKLVVASDPLRDDIEGETIVYARMRGLGSDRRYHTGRLEDLAEAIADAEEAFVVFATDTAFREATKLTAVLAGAEGEEDGETDEDDEDDEDEEDEDADDVDGDDDE